MKIHYHVVLQFYTHAKNSSSTPRAHFEMFEFDFGRCASEFISFSARLLSLVLGGMAMCVLACLRMEIGKTICINRNVMTNEY